ncbi:MAG: hypothetical protein IPH74_12435 [Bacteroidetes bacterium]|nr:hypothetical protein [Bacteroidota bacterium]
MTPISSNVPLLSPWQPAGRPVKPLLLVAPYLEISQQFVDFILPPAISSPPK